MSKEVMMCEFVVIISNVTIDDRLCMADNIGIVDSNCISSKKRPKKKITTRL